MARKPRDQHILRLLRTALLLLIGTGLTGCEVGRTMFQYNSGGSPWLGIDLLPRRSASLNSPKTLEPEPLMVAEKKLPSKEEKTADHQFHKKPLRLYLPSSRDELQETALSASEEPPMPISTTLRPDF